MGINRILKPGLFIYECFRTILLTFTLVFIGRRYGTFPWVGIAAPQTLFPLMTLFICINIQQYKNFIPLYIAGKTIGFAALLSWSIINGNITITHWASGDLFAVAAAIYLTKETKQCE